MTVPDPGLIAGTGCIAGALICWLAVKRHLSALRTDQRALRSDLESQLCERQAECLVRIEQLGENVAALERNAQSIDDAAKGGLTRSTRAQAMQLLRSGMAPEKAASALGVGRREMRLLASVSRTLFLK